MTQGKETPASVKERIAAADRIPFYKITQPDFEKQTTRTTKCHMQQQTLKSLSSEPFRAS